MKFVLRHLGNLQRLWAQLLAAFYCLWGASHTTCLPCPEGGHQLSQTLPSQFLPSLWSCCIFYYLSYSCPSHVTMPFKLLKKRNYPLNIFWTNFTHSSLSSAWINDWSHDKYNNLCMQLASSVFASHVLGTRLSIQNETKETLSISYLLRQIWINIEMYANRILIRRMERWLSSVCCSCRGLTRSVPRTYTGQLTTTGNYNSCLFQHMDTEATWTHVYVFPHGHTYNLK